MALKTTTKKLEEMLECLGKDLKKAERGNKAAAQRVRTCSIQFEKIAKQYRKESVRAERPTKKVTKKKTAKKKKTKRR